MFCLDSLAEINRVAYTLGELGMPEVHAVNICTKPTFQEGREKFKKLHDLVLKCNKIVKLDSLVKSCEETPEVW